MQRDAAEGSPLLFSGGRWFEEVDATSDPHVRDLHDGFGPGVRFTSSSPPTVYSDYSDRSSLALKRQTPAATTRCGKTSSFSPSSWARALKPVLDRFLELKDRDTQRKRGKALEASRQV